MVLVQRSSGWKGGFKKGVGVTPPPVRNDRGAIGPPKADRTGGGVICLASSSPRRKTLLKKAGIRFRVVKPFYHEKEDAGVSVSTLTRRHALGKALSVLPRVKNGLILGADTVVHFGSRVIGKPRSARHARAMLGALQGRKHKVLTSVALVRAKDGKLLDKVVFTEKTFVWLRPMSAKQIRQYQHRIGPLDKAGAYAIQSKGPGIVERVQGSFTNAVGLPMEKLKKTLRMLR